MMSCKDLLILLIQFFRYVGSNFENGAFLELCQMVPVPAIHTSFAKQTEAVDAMLCETFQYAGSYHGRTNAK